MPKYVAKEKSAVDNAIVEAGDVVDYTPPEGVTVSSNLEPYKEKGHAAENKETAHEKDEDKNKKTLVDDKGRK